MRFRIAFASRTMSRPSTVAVPEVGISSVVRILIVVVLPAPLGPSRPKSSPSGTASDRPSSATTSFRRRLIVPVVVRNVRWMSRSAIASTAGAY